MHFNVSVAPSKRTRMYKVYTFYTDVDAARSGYSDTEEMYRARRTPSARSLNHSRLCSEQRFALSEEVLA